ncbi:MAG: SGNH/GDSL hydrolase family protein [Verrucomicrobia bacterium]|nr:SGNH/GDSL hydrolase family protein [Verrucomicrobiota bacterium]
MRRVFTKSFLLVIALFCASELTVRIFFARSMSGRFDYGYHPTAGFQENADGSVDLLRTGGRRFHKQHFQKERPAGVFRILVIGDSVPRGGSPALAYSGQLAAQLEKQGVRVESLNLAVAGFGAHRSHLVLAKALDYQPSLIIRHVNNSNEYEDEREWRRSQDFKGWHPKNWLMKSLVLRRLYEMKTEKVFWEWVPEKIRAQASLNDADAQIATSLDERKVREWQERVRKFVGEDVAACRARGVPILLVAQARREKSADGKFYLDDHGLDELTAGFKAPDVAVVSMKQVFAPLDFAPLFGDGAHLFPKGHGVLAEAIAAELNGWLLKKN